MYDGFNRRVKTNSNEFSAYSQDGQLLYRQDGSEHINYMYLGARLVAKKTDGVVTLVHTDLLGSPVVETTPSKTILPRQHYKAFGDTVGITKDDVGYTGHKFDSDLGLSYMQARYYDPVIGRFYSNDPVDAAAFINQGNIQGFNRYKYSNNNPYKYIDPDGRQEISVFQELEVMAKGLFFDGTADANANGQRVIMQDVPQYAKASFQKDVALTAQVVGGVAEKVVTEGVGKAATVTAFVPGLQGVSLGLTAVDLAINGGVSELLGTVAGEGAGLVAKDALTDSGRKPGNWKVQIVTALASEGAKQETTSTIKPYEEKATEEK